MTAQHCKDKNIIVSGQDHGSKTSSPSPSSSSLLGWDWRLRNARTAERTAADQTEKIAELVRQLSQTMLRNAGPLRKLLHRIVWMLNAAQSKRGSGESCEGRATEQEEAEDDDREVLELQTAPGRPALWKRRSVRAKCKEAGPASKKAKQAQAQVAHATSGC